jgi:predicted nucleic acid-binding protein
VIKSSAKVVCDAGPFIHLDELNCLDLLADFNEIILPIIVEKEISEHRPSALKNQSLNINRPSGRTDIGEELLTLCRIFSLDAGETEALALMEENPQHIFLTDDSAARLVSEQMKFKVHGTVGVLLRAIRRKLREPEKICSFFLSRSDYLFVRVSPCGSVANLICVSFCLQTY